MATQVWAEGCVVDRGKQAKKIWWFVVDSTSTVANASSNEGQDSDRDDFEEQSNHIALEKVKEGASKVEAPQITAVTQNELVRDLCVKGSRVLVRGTLDPSATARPRINVEHLELLRCSFDAGLTAVRRVLDACKPGELSAAQVARALECDEDRVNEMLELQRVANDQEADKDSRQRATYDLRKEIVRANRRLRGIPEDRSRQRKAKARFQDVTLLDRVTKELTTKGVLQELHELDVSAQPSVLTAEDLEQMPRESRAVRRAKAKEGDQFDDDTRELVRALKQRKRNADDLPVDPLGGLSHDTEGDGSYVKYCLDKKAPQVRWMIDRLREMLERDASKGVESQDKEQVAIIDMGCGKGDLTLNVAACLPNVSVVGIDPNELSLRVARMRAVEHEIPNVKFFAQSAEDLLARKDMSEELTNLSKSSKVIFIGLHACGGLSDLLVALATKWDAEMLCATCCFHRYPELTELAGMPQGWGLEDAAALVRLTDLTVHEHASKAMQIVNSARISPQVRAMRDFHLLSFSSTYSPKNQVIQLLRS